MGVDYTAVFAIGKELDYEGEAVEFLREHGVLTDEHEAELAAKGEGYITEISYYDDKFPTVQCLNLYSGNYYYVGFPIQARDVDNLTENVSKAEASWHDMFPTVEANIIHTVRIH